MDASEADLNECDTASAVFVRSSGEKKIEVLDDERLKAAKYLIIINRRIKRADTQIELPAELGEVTRVRTFSSIYGDGLTFNYNSSHLTDDELDIYVPKKATIGSVEAGLVACTTEDGIVPTFAATGFQSVVDQTGYLEPAESK